MERAAAGLLHQRGGAGTTGKGDHQYRRWGGGGGKGEGLIQQQAVADRPSAAAVAVPFGGGSGHGPAQLTGGGGDQLIRAAGIAMEQLQHRPAGGMVHQGSADLGQGPGQITATTGHDHQRSGWSHCTGSEIHQKENNREERKSWGVNLPQAMGSGPLALSVFYQYRCTHRAGEPLAWLGFAALEGAAGAAQITP
jgi:hypothetical protein